METTKTTAVARQCNLPYSQPWETCENFPAKKSAKKSKKRRKQVATMGLDPTTLSAMQRSKPTNSFAQCI